MHVCMWSSMCVDFSFFGKNLRQLKKIHYGYKIKQMFKEEENEMLG